MTIENALHEYLETQIRQENEMCCTDIKAWLNSDRTDKKAPAQPQTNDVDAAILAIDKALTEC